MTGRDFDFDVVCLPRSGSMWMANFLSYGNFSMCVHEPELVDGFDPNLARMRHASLGVSSSGIIANTSYGDRPDKRVFIERDYGDSWNSYREFTDFAHPGLFAKVVMEFEGMDRKGCMVVDYEDLTGADTCEKVWGYIFDSSPMPRYRHMECSRMRVTTMDAAIGELKPVERKWQ